MSASAWTVSFDRRLGVDAVGVEHVHVIGAHTGQALLERAHEVLARAAVAVGTGPHVVAGLGREEQLVAVATQVAVEHGAEGRLGGAVGRAVLLARSMCTIPRSTAWRRISRWTSSGRAEPKFCHTPERCGGGDAAGPGAQEGHVVVAGRRGLVGGDQAGVIGGDGHGAALGTGKGALRLCHGIRSPVDSAAGTGRGGRGVLRPARSLTRELLAQKGRAGRERADLVVARHDAEAAPCRSSNSG